MKKFYFFDFDGVLTKRHTMDGIKGLGLGVRADEAPLSDKETIENVKRNIKHPQLLRALFNRIDKNGDAWGVVSFNEGSEHDKEMIRDSGARGNKYVRETLTIGIPEYNFKDTPISCAHEHAIICRLSKKNVLMEDSFNKQFPDNKIDFNLEDDVIRKQQLSQAILIEDSEENREVAESFGFRVAPLVDAENVYDQGYMQFLIKDTGLTVKELQEVQEAVKNNFMGSAEEKSAELKYVSELMAYAATLEASETKIAADTKAVKVEFDKPALKITVGEAAAMVYGAGVMGNGWTPAFAMAQPASGAGVATMDLGTPTAAMELDTPKKEESKFNFSQQR